MGLRIFGTDPENQPKPSRKVDDIVGRFRSGYQINGRPASLTDWRITTGDPDIATKVYEEFGGDEPQKWEAKGEDNLEVFTATNEVEIILEGPNALRERMILWGRNGKVISDSDGETLADGTPDPDRDLTFAERKKKGQDGVGPIPQIEVYFRLASDPDLGVFKFQSGSWSLAQDLARNSVSDTLDSIGGPTKASIALEEVSFTAKNGPRAGQLVQYTKPVLTIKGKAA